MELNASGGIDDGPEQEKVHTRHGNDIPRDIVVIDKPGRQCRSRDSGVDHGKVYTV